MCSAVLCPVCDTSGADPVASRNCNLPKTFHLNAEPREIHSILSAEILMYLLGWESSKEQKICPFLLTVEYIESLEAFL